MLVARPLPADLDLLALHRLAPGRYPLLLESAAHGTAHGRWDLLLATSGESLSLDTGGVVRRQDGATVDGDFLSVLDAQRAKLSAEDEQAKAVTAVTVAMVTLYRAFGGGWNGNEQSGTASMPQPRGPHAQ